MRERAGDLVSALLLLALAVAVFVLTLGFPPPAQPSDPGTAAFPRIVAVALGMLAVAQLLRPKAGEPLPRGLHALRVAGIVALLLAYIVVLEPLGFIIATALFLLGALLLAGVRNPLYLLLLSPGMSVVLFYVFYNLLEVSLPQGLMEGVLF